MRGLDYFAIVCIRVRSTQEEWNDEMFMRPILNEFSVKVALKRISLGFVLDCSAPCLEESLLSLAKLRLEEVEEFHWAQNVWMFGSRTTVKKVVILAISRPLGRIPFLPQECVFFELTKWDVVEIPAEHQVAPGGLFRTIQEGSHLELEFVRMERLFTVDVQRKEWGELVQEVLLSYYKGHSVPLVFDFKSLLKDLSGKEAEALMWMHSWSIVRSGGRLERALINSSDVDLSQT